MGVIAQLTFICSFGEIVGYLERQYDDILAEESRIKRNPRFRDNRVHVLLYFITPTGHGLRELDIELMKRLSPRVNVIPVIGKADSLTPAELAESKKLIMEDIEHYRIPVYNFPYDIEEDDEDTVEENAELRGLMPFAIVGSEDFVEIDNRKVRARQYPWGVVEVENPRHSDFLAIRSALLHSHLADLKEITHDFLYENYRTEKLSKSVDGANPYASLSVGRLITLLTHEQCSRFHHEPRGPRLSIRPPQGGAAPSRGGEAARDRNQGAARDCREATGAAGPREPAQRDRGSHGPRGKPGQCQRSQCRGLDIPRRRCGSFSGAPVRNVIPFVPTSWTSGTKLGFVYGDNIDCLFTLIAFFSSLIFLSRCLCGDGQGPIIRLQPPIPPVLHRRATCQLGISCRSLYLRAHRPPRAPDITSSLVHFLVPLITPGEFLFLHISFFIPLSTPYPFPGTLSVFLIPGTLSKVRSAARFPRLFCVLCWWTSLVSILAVFLVRLVNEEGKVSRLQCLSWVDA